MKQIPHNTDTEGCASCIKANYYKMGAANFIGHTNDGLKATCVIETMDKRLTKLLQSGIPFTDTCMLDTYNQQVQDNVSCTIRTNINTANHHFIMEKEQNNQIITVGYVNDGKHQQDYIQHEDGISRAICCGTHGSGPHLTKTMVSEPIIIGNKQMNPFRGDINDVAPCITSACGAGGGMTPMLTDADVSTTKTNDFIEQVRGHQPMQFRIRKLTERECFRLMGLADTEISKIQASGVSRSQQYKMAGNSIVVDVLFHIFRKLYIEPQCEHQQLTLF